MKSRRILLGIIFAALALHIWTFRGYTVDDAFITFCYARNVAEGQGPVYKSGERVEGYTNFLWMMLMAFAIKSGLDVLITAKILGAIFTMITLILVYRISTEVLRSGPLWSLLSIALLASSGSFTLWAVAGLETALFCMLVTAGMYRYLKDWNHGTIIPISGFLFGLSYLARPEGALFFAVSAVHRLIWIYRSKERLQKREIIWALLFLIVFTSHFLWSLWYYGRPLPNTYYIKTSGGIHKVFEGIDYLYRFAMFHGGPMFLLSGMVVFFLASSTQTHRYAYSYLLFGLISFWAYIVLIAGADWMPFFRYPVVTLPSLYLLIQEGVREIYPYLAKHLRSVRFAQIGLGSLIAAQLVFNALPSYQIQRNHDYDTNMSLDANVHDNGGATDTGKWLGQISPADAVIAVADAGAIVYYSGLWAIDMVGLVEDERVRVDADYVLSKEPMFIQYISSFKHPIYEDRRFQEEYVLIPKFDTPRFEFFVRRNQMARWMVYLRSIRPQDQQTKSLIDWVLLESNRN